MRLRSRFSRGLATTFSWRAFLLVLGLGLPACRQSAEPAKPQPPTTELIREDLMKGLVLATFETSGNEQKTIQPRLVYRKGNWEPIDGPRTGPSQWFPLSPGAQPLQTEKKTAQYRSGCEQPFWALRVTGEAPEPEIDLVFSQKLAPRPIQEAPANLQAAVQGALEAQAATELQSLKQQLRARPMNSPEPATDWTQVQPPENERALCSPVTESEWICYARQQRELRATNGGSPDSNQCTSLFWLRGSVTAMRILQSTRECLSLTPEPDPMGLNEGPPPERKPVSVLMLENHPYWILSNSWGPGGFELWEARADSMRLVTKLQHQWGACD